MLNFEQHNCSAWTESIWTSYNEDLLAYALVVAGNGQVLHANAAAGRWLGVNPRLATSNTLDSLFPSRIATERLEHVRQVLHSGETLLVHGMIRGEGLCAIMRPLPADQHGQAAVLMLLRPLADVGDQRLNGNDVAIPIQARFNELGLLERLTPREIQVLAFVAQGMSSHEIAFKLKLSRRTIDCHRASIGHKLNASGVAELTIVALRAGLIRGTQDKAADQSEASAPAIRESMLESVIHARQNRHGRRMFAGHVSHNEHDQHNGHNSREELDRGSRGSAHSASA